MVSLRLWLAMRRCAALSMAFCVMDVVDMCVAVVRLLVRQAEIMSVTDTMNMMQFMCFAFMVEYVFCISICTKISNLCITAK
jgi:hypothetical protein